MSAIAIGLLVAAIGLLVACEAALVPCGAALVPCGAALVPCGAALVGLRGVLACGLLPSGLEASDGLGFGVVPGCLVATSRPSVTALTRLAICQHAAAAATGQYGPSTEHARVSY